MGLQPIFARARFVAYELPTGRLAVLEDRAPRAGRPQAYVAPTAALVTFVRDLLIDRQLLFRAGATPVVRTPAGPHLCDSTGGLLAALGELVHFAIGQPPAAWTWERTADRALEDPDLVWESLARGSGLHALDLTATGAVLWRALSDARQVPQYGGELAHPLVGEAPVGWFSPPPPARPSEADLALLRRLFDPLPTRMPDRLRLYAYLLAAFHADSLDVPSPLLVCDSWMQGVGKTEALAAIGYILDDEPSSLTPPRGGDTEELVAHFVRGKRLACLDNLTGACSWNHPWVASILTDRATSARAKYGRTSTTFRGRLAALSLVWGTASLHKDLLSRTWRVQLRGEAQPLAHRPNRFAAEHRAALRRAAYWTVAEAPTWRLGRITDTRCGEIEQLGAAACAHLFGATQEETAAYLQMGAKDACALSTEAIHLAMSQNIPLYDEPCVRTPRPLPVAIQRGLLGTTFLGHEVIEDEQGKVKVR